MADRIIDCDIDHYTAYVETEEARLRRCLPKDEPKYRARLAAARAALEALKNYRAVIDSEVDLT